jgi:hypothetical protein
VRSSGKTSEPRRSLPNKPLLLTAATQTFALLMRSLSRRRSFTPYVRGGRSGVT